MGRHAYWGLLGVGLLASGTFAPVEAEARALDHLLETHDIGSHKMPNKGTSHILVIPVHVGPEGFDAAQYAELQAQFALDGSFRRYWQDLSGGRFDPIPTLVAPVEYPDSCPIPGRTVDTCTVGFGDTDLIGGGLRSALTDVLERVRDGQNVDLAQFDVNTGSGPGSDGFFDGIITITNIAEGVSLPLVPFGNETVVKTAPGGGGTDITMSLLAMAPPIHHEFAHMFGFIDLYGGPTMNGLMNDSRATIAAFSRQQVGWADVTVITESVEIVLPPVLSTEEDGGNQIIRVNMPDDPARYLLIENRGGPMHEAYDPSEPGIQIYSVDESTLSEGELHFVDIVASALKLPNESPPYLNVSLPVDCNTTTIGAPTSCSMALVGEERLLTHANGLASGWTIRLVDVGDNGVLTIQIFDKNGPPVKSEPTTDADGDCSISIAGSDDADTSAWLMALAGLAWLRRRKW